MRSCVIAVLLLLVTSLSYGDDWRDQDRGGGRHGGHQRALRLYDAKGEVVGKLASYGGYDGVFLAVNGVVTFAQITRLSQEDTGYSPSRFQWSTGTRVDFESPHCGGAPVIEWQSNGPRPSINVRQGGEAILYVGSDTSTASIPLASAIVEGQCVPFAFSLSVVRSEASFSLTQHYPEPLTVGY